MSGLGGGGAGRGGGACSRGWPGPGGACSGGVWSRGWGLLRGGGVPAMGVWSGGGCLVETSPRWLLLQIVRILPECILVHAATMP